MLVERILLQLQIPFDKEVRYKSEKFERTFRIDFVVKIKDQVFFLLNIMECNIIIYPNNLEEK